MSEYRIKSSGEIKSQGEIRKLNPNVSLPRVWGANVMESLGIDPVLASPKPDASGEYKTVVRNGVEQDANGNWVYAWTERDMFSDYTDEDGNVVTKTDQENDYTAKKIAEAAKSVRTKRDSLLAETDWMALSDVTMSAEMAAYRQALRDITTHANFPNLEDADWPTKP
jgi:predicted lipoprotein with Yx(FWY)xxD motif